ncbi:MAG: hypothetical protein ACOC9Q_01855 [bacterium]
MRTVNLPDELYERLERLAQPFVDKEPADVIQRLVDKFSNDGRREMTASPSVDGRFPRERGIRIAINGHIIEANSVREMYEIALEYLQSIPAWELISERIPYKTSARRFLISDKPTHPNGNDFVVPVEIRGFYMESHKDYKTAVRQLAALLAKCGVKLQTV